MFSIFSWEFFTSLNCGTVCAFLCRDTVQDYMTIPLIVQPDRFDKHWPPGGLPNWWSNPFGVCHFRFTVSTFQQKNHHSVAIRDKSRKHHPIRLKCWNRLKISSSRKSSPRKKVITRKKTKRISQAQNSKFCYGYLPVKKLRGHDIVVLRRIKMLPVEVSAWNWRQGSTFDGRAGVSCCAFDVASECCIYTQHGFRGKREGVGKSEAVLRQFTHLTHPTVDSPISLKL